ncbi:MAG: hypothetical protein H6819_05535 [Phycisphaerales bacterium]|nr:hypothetical protein [Phycisphaerales bacterium]MCB9854758.1 hypothetical protein [Phycisphaerales bacterium]MCB9863770.1 hypothetical protein [Phycisphaerales bacterium]
MIVSPGESCLQCRYSLKGLPYPYRCPECGLAYDAETVVFRPKRPWYLIPRGIIVMSLVVLYLGEAAIAPSLSGWMLLRVLAGIGAGIAAVVYAVQVVRFCRGQGCLIALTADAIVVRSTWGAIRTMRFEDVGFIRVKDRPAVVARKFESGTQRLRTPIPDIKLDVGFDSEEEMYLLEQMVTERTAALDARVAGSERAVTGTGT